ncbi:MAG TPA: hypothetical protein VMR45_05810 [Patescibacteria group bacterium]|nr:hypothetical protein [Patescibacteria group bacterium]
MSSSVHEYPVNFGVWRDVLPETYESLAELHRRGQRCAVFSGTLACWYGIRQSTADTDLLVHQDDFWDAAKILGATTRRRQFDVLTGRSSTLRYEGYEALAMRDGRPIQMIQPITPAVCGEYEYEIGLSDRAVEACTSYQGILAAHLFDTIGPKLIMWRQDGHSPAGFGKHDITDAHALASKIPPEDYRYVIHRAAEIGLGRDKSVVKSLQQMLPFIEVPTAGLNNGSVLV